MSAYLRIHAKPADELFRAAEESDGQLPISEWTLESLGKYPILVDGSQSFPLDLVALGHSLYYGVPQALRHSATTNGVIVNHRKIPWREIAGVQGQIVEDYIWEMMNAYWPENSTRTSRRLSESDFHFTCGKVRLVIEAKSTRMTMKEFHKASSLSDIQNIISKRFLAKAVAQLKNTLANLHHGRKSDSASDLALSDTRIVPVIVTDQLLPESELLYEPLFSSAADSLQSSFPALTISRLRVMSLSDLERCLCRESPRDFAIFMLQWSQPSLCRLDFNSAAKRLNYSPPSIWSREAINKLKKYLAERDLVDSGGDSLSVE